MVRAPARAGRGALARRPLPRRRHRHSWRSAGTILPLLLAAAGGAWAQTCGPTLYSITVDGDMSDWTPVLADPDNFTTDPQGTQAPSADRDYPVQSRGRDLLGFAYTWDATRFYLYARRSGSASSSTNFLFYADRDDDGRMGTTDRVVLATWQGNNRSYILGVFAYTPASPAGDPMLDANGFADGYTLPGRLVTLLNISMGTGGSADGMQLEVGVPWTWIGVPAGGSMQFHASTANSTNLPNAVDDNMAGPTGAGNSTRYARIAVTPDLALTAAAGDTLVLAHTVRNDGNTSARVEMSAGWDCPETLAARFLQDADGDGRYTPGTDPALADSNHDGRVDRDVAPGAPVEILVVAPLPAGLAGGSTCTLHVVAEPRDVPECGAEATDTIRIAVPQLTLLRAADRSSAPPGQLLTYTTTYTNTGTLAVRSVVVESAVPSCTTYVSGSASGDGTVASFSHDDGATWDALETPPVTHVRWTLSAALPGGTAGDVSFQVRVD